MTRRGLRRLPRPLFVSVLLAATTQATTAQDPVRPWLDWRTIETRHYRFHYARELEDWTRHVAAHVEQIDSAIVALVGHAPPRPVHVVVDDPYALPNGYALPFIDRPVSVWWAVPPDPRTDVGNYRTWGELLSVHELTHIAHLTRPSRNPLQRHLWASLPASLGPIPRKAPRWVYEGYATMIEGRITGTGRPNNVWRPALLRQWAIEGRLPGYGQLSGSDDFEGDEFAYLNGSAFLEWLARRDGDSSLVHVWRRMTARVVRSFDASFAGVYGDDPSILYGKHVAELTRDAMAAKAALERDGLVEGELVQRLAWDTGDPALSPNGERIALTLRERNRPARVVVWTNAPEPPDTAAVRQRIEIQNKDPQDVPERRIYPPRKRAVKTLAARNGRPYVQPRWFADNRRVLLTRWAPRGDGTLRPDLFAWNTETGDVTRLTRGAGALHADPHPAGNDAVAMQCRRGHCDIAHVDLRRGALRTLLEGNAERSYYRPRYSPDGSRFAASVNEGGRWRIVVADASGSNVTYVDPDDGANRYDAEWLRGRSGDTLVAVSERGGIANLELLALANAGTRTLTRVTGAAVAPEVDPRDGSIWFLALHSTGFDVRRLQRSTAADSVVDITADRFGFAGLHTPNVVTRAADRVPPSRSYGAGPRHERWLPGAYYSAEGGGALITIFAGDIVGRLNATVTGAFGEPGTMRGGSLRATWRYPRFAAIELGAHAFIHEPSLSRYGLPETDSLDASVSQSLLALSRERSGDGWRLRARLGGGAGVLSPRLGPVSHFRGLGFAESALQLIQMRGSQGLVERLRVHVTQGHTRATYRRAIGSLEIETVGRDALPLELRATLGRVSGSPQLFERLSVGGSSPPVADSSLLSQRYSMPMFPTGVATGEALLAWRVALPTSTWTIFYEGASTAADVDAFRKWNRAVGLDMRYLLPVVPVAFAPRFESRGGIAYTLDEPFRKKVRVFLEMRMEP